MDPSCSAKDNCTIQLTSTWGSPASASGFIFPPLRVDVKKMHLSDKALYYLQKSRKAHVTPAVKSPQPVSMLAERHILGTALTELVTDDLNDVCQCKCHHCGLVMDSAKVKAHLKSKHGLNEGRSSLSQADMVHLTHHR